MIKNQDDILLEIENLIRDAAHLDRDEFRTLLEEVQSTCQDHLDGLDTDDDSEQ